MRTKTQKKKGPVKSLLDLFCSIKLSLFVLMALAATSIFGTVIQQGKGPAVYAQEYGQTAAKLIEVFRLDNMYHSWWFTLLLALLLTNIAFCSVKRLPQAIRLMRYREPVFDGRPVAFHERFVHQVKGVDVQGAADRVEKILKGRLGKIERAEKDGAVYLFGTRGGWSRMGVYVTHSSLFLFAIGAMLGTWWGFKGFVQIPEGASVSQVQLRSGGVYDLGFEVRCDKFQVSFYKDAQGRQTGRPKDYVSDLTVLEGGREVVKKTIEVNDPLIHNGIFFYQSSYGQAAGRASWITVFGPERNLITHRQKVFRGGRIDLENGATLVVQDFTGDFKNMGPAAQVVVEREGQDPARTVVFQAPEGNNRKVGGYVVRLEGVDTAMYTGLQVAKDPGVPVVWAGCVLITLGCLVAFFVSHRRVWARVRPGKKGVEVFVGGNASRNRLSFEQWFETLCSKVQETFEK